MQSNQSLPSAQSVRDIIFAIQQQLCVAIAAAYGAISLLEQDPLSETIGVGLKHSLHEAEELLDVLETRYKDERGQ